MAGLGLPSLRDPLEEKILPRLVLPVPPDLDPPPEEESSKNFFRGQSLSSADGGGDSSADDFASLLGVFS